MTNTGQPKSHRRRPLIKGKAASSDAEANSEMEDLDASGFLLLALGARRAAVKKEFALRGLALLGGGPGIGGMPAADKDEEEAELRALLLRQTYLSAIEEGDDESALRIAEEMIELGALGDIARQDAARAALGVDDTAAAIGHLRIAARVCPPNRRAFHYAHLGSLLRFDGQMDQAIEAFTKATRWATEDRFLYQAQQALAEAENGRTEADLEALRERLENDSPMKAYALWILGELCLILGDEDAAAEYLRRFVSRQAEAPRAKSLALKGELSHASALLRKVSA